ncbi:MAG: transposase, partial [Candidatus Thorarchaeota archaeon]
ESFLCTSCGMSLDADFNASLNILHGGVYGLATT